MKTRIAVLSSLLFVVGTLASGCSSNNRQDTATREAERRRVERIEAGGDRAYQDIKNRIALDEAGGVPAASNKSKNLRRWRVNLTFSACPAASDWLPLADALKRGDVSVELPSSCRKLQPGEIIHAPLKGGRETVTHDGHDYARIELTGGRIMWTDSLDEITASDLGEVKQIGDNNGDRKL